MEINEEWREGTESTFQWYEIEKVMYGFELSQGEEKWSRWDGIENSGRIWTGLTFGDFIRLAVGVGAWGHH